MDTCGRQPPALQRTFRESFSIGVDLQGIQSADLQVHVVVQELLQDGLAGQQQLLLLLQLLLGGRGLVLLHHAQLLGDELQEAGWAREGARAREREGERERGREGGKEREREREREPMRGGVSDGSYAKQSKIKVNFHPRPNGQVIILWLSTK